jgi:dTDP-4-amino-4,6-dideoxygalactose transaminase
MSINVTKTFLPPFEEYISQLKRAWDKGWVTNNGELVQELERKLKEWLGVKHLLYCSNGTVALQMAIKALDLTGEIITTPFSYVATTGAILWERCTPVFADIDEKTFCLYPGAIEERITPRTQAILATHVYGYPCDTEKIADIGRKHGLKVIYDGAHAFGTMLNGISLFNHGDISTCSFHATKLFHTVSGGCVITEDEALAKKLFLYRQFGHIYDDYYSIGINGKNSEFHAAMGLCNLEHIDDIFKSRKEQWLFYQSQLQGANLQLLKPDPSVGYNYAYFPVVFESEQKLLKAFERLNSKDIFPRRYFYPSLNKLPYLQGEECKKAESIAKRIACLPLYVGLTPEQQQSVCVILNEKKE